MRKIARSTNETPAEGRYRKLFAERKRGESFAALAARVGVAPGTLSWWRHELRRRDRTRAGTSVPLGGDVPTNPGPCPSRDGAVRGVGRGSSATRNERQPRAGRQETRAEAARRPPGGPAAASLSSSRHQAQGGPACPGGSAAGSPVTKESRTKESRTKESRTSMPALLPVRLLEAAPLAPARGAATYYEVALAGGRRVIRVPTGFEPEAVRALVAAVEGASC